MCRELQINSRTNYCPIVSQWKSETSMGGLSKPKRTHPTPQNVNQFAPQGKNPKELKQKVLEVRPGFFSYSTFVEFIFMN